MGDIRDVDSQNYQVSARFKGDGIINVLRCLAVNGKSIKIRPVGKTRKVFLSVQNSFHLFERSLRVFEMKGDLFRFRVIVFLPKTRFYKKFDRQLHFLNPRLVKKSLGFLRPLVAVKINNVPFNQFKKFTVALINHRRNLTAQNGTHPVCGGLRFSLSFSSEFKGMERLGYILLRTDEVAIFCPCQINRVFIHGPEKQEPLLRRNLLRTR